MQGRAGGWRSKQDVAEEVTELGILSPRASSTKETVLRWDSPDIKDRVAHHRDQ